MTGSKINYTEQGTGPVALFVHGVLLNGYLWRHQLAHLSDIRRCIAVDLLAHGDTEIAPDQDVSVTANAEMLAELLDQLEVDAADVVGNDSGGGIAQIFAARHPSRVRTLALTNCDAHDNWPPEAFKPFLAMAAAGGLRDALQGMLADTNLYRSPQALGPAYEHPDRVTDDTIERYLRPFLRSDQRTRDLNRFLAAFDNTQTTAIEPRLKSFTAPTLIVWGTDDVYFPRQMVALARGHDSGHAPSRRAPRCADLLSRGAMGGVQRRAARILAGLATRGAPSVRRADRR